MKIKHKICCLITIISLCKIHRNFLHSSRVQPLTAIPVPSIKTITNLHLSNVYNHNSFALTKHWD